MVGNWNGFRSIERYYVLYIGSWTFSFAACACNSLGDGESSWRCNEWMNNLHWMEGQIEGVSCDATNFEILIDEYIGKVLQYFFFL